VIVDGRRFLIVGHRGAAARAPENTAASLSAGLAAGADQIEVDAGLTRDGRVVLLHDTTLDRTTSGRGPLRARTWRDVRRLDAGRWFSRRFAGEPPIDLDDALAIVRARVPLIVEVKPVAAERARGIDPADRATVDGVLAAIERTGGARGVTISSAGWTLLAYAARKRHGLDLALTVGSAERRDPIAWARRIGATALHPSRRLCSPEFVGRARALGLLVIPYTVNRTAELAPLLAAGVDGVFTDDPAALRRLLARRGRREAADGNLALGIDQGSGGTRAVLVSGRGEIVASRAAPVASRHGRDGAIVQDPEAVVASVARAAGPLVKAAGRRLTVAGLAVQRSSLVVWRARDVKPVTPVLSWRSGAATVVPPAIAAREDDVHRWTGLTTRHPYGAIRLAALGAATPEISEGLRQGRLVAGPLGAFIVARLADGPKAACDPSLAQRTLAYDVLRGMFSPELAELYGVPAGCWPDVAPSVGARGRLKLEGHRVPLRALAGDVGAAARAIWDEPGADADGVLVLGTGGFLVAPTSGARRDVDGLLTTLLFDDEAGPIWAVEGTVHGLAAGIVEAGRRGGWDALPAERIAARGGPADPATVDAAVEGTGTPDWETGSRFTIEPDDAAPESIVGGAIASLASRFGRIATLLRAAGSAPARLVATGGLSGSPHLTAAIARACSMPVSVDPRPHRTAVGAALLARDGA
jgi:glycerol kinase/glycerophosphoryl diester phosphodiesterase